MQKIIFAAFARFPTYADVLSVGGVAPPALVVTPTAVPNQGAAPLSVVLASGIAGGTAPYAFSWDFGDGSEYAVESNPRHVYTQPGAYTATLTVTDGAGQSQFGTIAITVLEGGDTSTTTPTADASSGLGKAIIIAGGGAHETNTLFPSTNELCQNFYRILKKRGFSDSDILYMTPYPMDTDRDGFPNPEHQDFSLFNPQEELESAFSIAAQGLTVGKQFVLYIHGHASPDSLKINNQYDLPATEFRRLLDGIPAGVSQIVIIDTCYSGSFLDDLKGVSDRVVMTSSDGATTAWNVRYANFSDKLFYGVRLGRNLLESFQAAEEMILSNPDLFGDQRAQLDDDGDGIYSQSRDGLKVARLYIGKEGMSQAEPPIVTQVHPPIQIPEGQASATLWVKTHPSYEGIDSVIAVLIRPDFEVTAYQGEETEYTRKAVALIYNAAQDRYETAYDAFHDAGTWRIMYKAQGTEGDWSDAEFGEVNAPGVATDVIVDTWTNQSAYRYGDSLTLGVNVNSRIDCDLYALIIYPDGQLFQTIAYPGNFSMNYDVVPYQKNIGIAPDHSFSVIKQTVKQSFPPGLYVFGAFAVYPSFDPLLVDQWIHLAYDVFEVKP